MTIIFLGGSRDIFELPVPAIERIGAIVAAEHGVLIGDAPGADAEMQGLLAGYKYEHVGVFHAGKEPRNICGTATRARTFCRHFIQRDRCGHMSGLSARSKTAGLDEIRDARG